MIWIAVRAHTMTHAKFCSLLLCMTCCMWGVLSTTTCYSGYTTIHSLVLVVNGSWCTSTYLSIYVYLSICMYLRYVGMYLSSRLVVCMGAGAAVKRRAQGDNHAEKSDKHLGIYLYKRIQRECYLEGPKEVLDRFITACLEAFGRRDETIFKLASENYS